MPADVTFVACVEPGAHRLEYKAATLFQTMRSNMGDMSDAPIRAYAPRPGVAVSSWLRELMDHYEITYVDEPLNAAHSDYPLANKPLALAHAERTANTRFVVFLDTDILVWRAPKRLLLDDRSNIALVPDTTKTTASSGPGDRFEAYWEDLYRLVGATERPFVTTTLTQERVRGTWNSGVIALRRSAGIAAAWKDAMLAVLERDFAPPEAAYLRENNVLSAIGAAHYDRLLELPVAYNYPVQSWRTIVRTSATSPEEAILWHYQPFFDRTYKRFAASIDRSASLKHRLALTQNLVEDLRLNYDRRVGLDESALQRLRKRLRLGPRLRAMIGRSKSTDSNFS